MFVGGLKETYCGGGGGGGTETLEWEPEKIKSETEDGIQRGPVQVFVCVKQVCSCCPQGPSSCLLLLISSY